MTAATNMDSVFCAYQFQLGFLNNLLRDIDEANRAHQPLAGEFALKNHPAWQVGHMAIASDGILGVLGQERQLGEEFKKRFGRGSEPVGEVDQYPTLQELFQVLSGAHDRAISAFKETDEARLASQNPMENFVQLLPTVRDMAVFMMTTHESIHLGQLTMWRKAMGLPNLVG